MKKLFVMAAMVLSSVGAFAQQAAGCRYNNYSA